MWNPNMPVPNNIIEISYSRFDEVTLNLCLVSRYMKVQCYGIETINKIYSGSTRFIITII